jgi:hypothetical protein
MKIEKMIDAPNKEGTDVRILGITKTRTAINLNKMDINVTNTGPDKIKTIRTVRIPNTGKVTHALLIGLAAGFKFISFMILCSRSTGASKS